MFNMPLWTSIHKPRMTLHSHWKFKLHGNWKLCKNLGMVVQYLLMQHLAQIKVGYTFFAIV
jgi:hypothetical protein